MAEETRHRDQEWNLGGIGAGPGGRVLWDQVKAAVLMDLRDELKELNGRLRCMAGGWAAVQRDLRRMRLALAGPVKKTRRLKR